MSIYCIRNCENGKCYIGQTVQSVAQRWSKHKSSAKLGATGPLYDAIRNMEGFEVTTLETDIQEGRSMTDSEKEFCKTLFESTTLNEDLLGQLKSLTAQLDKLSKRSIVYMLRFSDLDQRCKTIIRSFCKPESALDAAEKRWIKELQSFYPKGYNVTPGGQMNKRKCKYYAKRCRMLQAS